VRRESRFGAVVTASAVRALIVVSVVYALFMIIRPQPAFCDWLQPDASYRDTQLNLRFAARDTVDHPNDPARLDSVGVALLRLARLDEARRVFTRVIELDPKEPIARAALGKLALFDDRTAEAESLLTGLETSDPLAASDLYSARLRRGEWGEAADLAGLVNQEGRRELLERLKERAPYEITAGPSHAVVQFQRAYPIPLVRVKLNGELVLMAIDTGASDLLIDEQAFRHNKVTPVPGRSIVFWTGSRSAVKNALVQRLELGGFRIENCPAGVLNLGRWSLEVNPQSERVAGVIGLNLLKRFLPTLDFKAQKLELRRLDQAWTPKEDAARVPFQMWGESELTVFGSLAQGRRMAMVVQTGVPGCGVGAPQDVMDEIGVKAGVVARMVKGAGTFLHGSPWSPVVVPSVTIGPLAEDKVPGWIGALDATEMWRHGVRRDALVSNDFFKGRRLTIDWSKRELVVEGS
jgi:Aspartyl protease